MATNVQRVTAIMEGLRNDTADLAMLERIAAFCIELRRGEIIDAGLDPDNLTNDEKARVILDFLQHILRQHFMRVKSQQILTAAADDITSSVGDLNETAE